MTLVFCIAVLAVGAALYLASLLFRGVEPEDPPLDDTAFLHMEDR